MRRSSPSSCIVPVLAAGVLGLAACGGSGGEQAAPAGPTPPAPSPLACPISAVEIPAPPGVSADLSVKPVVPPASGPAPAELQYADLVEGNGAEAFAGSQVEVKYVGAFYETGQEFDSSWSRGADQTLPFGICQRGVIPGFAVGPSGMKVGGRRTITIPSDLGYGPQGSPPKIPGGATLVFVVDLVRVR